MLNKGANVPNSRWEPKRRREQGQEGGRGRKGHFMVSTDQKLEERVGVRLNVRPRAPALVAWCVCELVGLDGGRGGLRVCALAKGHRWQRPPARCFQLH